MYFFCSVSISKTIGHQKMYIWIHFPIILPNGKDVAPEKVFQMTRYKYSLSQCKTNRYSCIKTGTNCSEFCGCQDCENQKDLEKSESEDENDMVDYEGEDIADV